MESSTARAEAEKHSLYVKLGLPDCPECCGCTIVLKERIVELSEENARLTSGRNLESKLRADAEAENARLRKLSGEKWVRVGERLPEDGVGVLVWRGGLGLPADDHDQAQWDVGWLDYDDKPPVWVISGEISDDITHWMPLPSPPPSESEEEKLNG